MLESAAELTADWLTAALSLPEGAKVTGFTATQVGAALGTAAFTAIGISAGGAGAHLAPGGFTAAFTAAAAVALATAVLGATIARSRS